MNRRPTFALDMAPARRGGASTLIGLWTPPQQTAGSDPGSRYVHTFITYRELGGEDLVDEEWITSRLERISVYDCLPLLGRLSCQVLAAATTDARQQAKIIRGLGFPEPDAQALEAELVAANGRRAMFFPQQLVHLARLAVLHADPRPSDDFADRQLVSTFLECLLGVTELLTDDSVDLDLEENQVSWVLRQLAINGQPDSVALWTRYYDIFTHIWREVPTPEMFEAEEAFLRYTGLSIERWLTVGFGVYVQFLAFGRFQFDHLSIDGPQFFEKTSIQPDEWASLRAQTAATYEQLRDEIVAEEAALGPTLYRCQAFEMRPLLLLPDDRVVPIAIDSFERRITEGIFWILSDGAMAEGLPREHFSSAFGRVFEEWGQRTFERAIPSVGTPRVHRAHPYKGAHGSEVDSTDVVLDYEPAAVFVEIVAKRQSTATLTRGDLVAFRNDLCAGVLKKAKQLDRNVRDFRDERLILGDMTPGRISQIFPVVLSVEGFPSMPPISQLVVREVEENGWLSGLPPLALISGEDLAAIEALMEQGVSFVEMLARWRLSPEVSALSFANFYDMSPDIAGHAQDRSTYQDSTWQELINTIRVGLFHQGSGPASG